MSVESKLVIGDNPRTGMVLVKIEHGSKALWHSLSPEQAEHVADALRGCAETVRGGSTQ